MDRFKSHVIFVVLLAATINASSLPAVSPESLQLDYDSQEEFTITLNITSFMTRDILMNNPVLTVNFVSNSPDVVEIVNGSFSRNLTENDTSVDVTVVMASGKAGNAEVTMEISWVANGNVSMETFTLSVEVPAPVYLETTTNYALIYVNMLVAFICIIFVGCDLTPGDILRTWGRTSVWIFAGFILYAAIRPVVSIT